MSQFETISVDAFAQLQDSLGEPVTLLRQGQNPKAITAVIERGDLQQRGGGTVPGNNQPAYILRALIARSDLPTINLGSDKISFLIRLGDTTPATRTLAALIGEGQDLASWYVGLSA